MIDPDVINFAGVMATLVGSAAGVGLIWVSTKWALVAAERHKQEPRHMLPDSRLEQLQQSVDAIAIEVERIAEAQRFSAKLLAGREAEQRLPR